MIVKKYFRNYACYDVTMKKQGLLAPQYRDADAAREYLESKCWPDGPVCPQLRAYQSSLQVDTKARIKERRPQGRMEVQRLSKAVRGDRRLDLSGYSYPTAQVAIGNSSRGFVKEKNLCAPVDAEPRIRQLSQCMVYSSSHSLGANARTND